MHEHWRYLRLLLQWQTIPVCWQLYISISTILLSVQHLQLRWVSNVTAFHGNNSLSVLYKIRQGFNCTVDLDVSTSNTRISLASGGTHFDASMSLCNYYYYYYIEFNAPCVSHKVTNRMRKSFIS